MVVVVAPHHSVFTGRMPFLPPSQQRQSTEGYNTTTLHINTACTVHDVHLYTAKRVKQRLNTVTVQLSEHRHFVNQARDVSAYGSGCLKQAGNTPLCKQTSMRTD